jgi:carbon storage regulator
VLSGHTAREVPGGCDPFRATKGRYAMLVLTRKLMEKLFIGDDICVTVVRLEGGQVRLGIEAPREIAVVRAELVPDRRFGSPRPDARPADPSVQPPHPAPHGGPGRDVRMPPTSAHGTDSRRRGPFR